MTSVLLPAAAVGVWWSCALATALLLVITRIASGYYQSRSQQCRTAGARPVPIAPYWVPYLGHIPNFVLGADKLLKRFRDGGAGLVGVNFLGTTHTLIFSPRLTSAVFAQRSAAFDNHKFIWFFTHTIGGVPAYAKENYAHAYEDYEASFGYMMRDPYLADMMEILAKNMGEGVAHLVPRHEGDEHGAAWWSAAKVKTFTPATGQFEVTANLMALIVHFLAHMAAPSIFGTDLLRNNPNLIYDLLDFNDGFLILPLSFPSWFPWPLLQRAIKGRNRVIEATRKLQVALDREAAGLDPGPEWTDLADVSRIIRERRLVSRKHGIGPEATPDLALLWALNANSNFLIFWLLVRILSDPQLAAAVRKESAPFISRNGVSGSYGVDERRLAAACPLLKACVIEALRLDSATWSFKCVARDVVLAEAREDESGSTPRAAGDGWLLRRGTYVHVPSDLHHTDPRFFADPAAFRPERHLVRVGGAGDATDATEVTAQWGTVRPFGGGGGVCKGRKYAEREVMAAVALVLAAWDISPADGGAWRLPGRKRATGVYMPNRDVRVTLKPRNHIS